MKNFLNIIFSQDVMVRLYCDKLKCKFNRFIIVIYYSLHIDDFGKKYFVSNLKSKTYRLSEKKHHL